MKRLIAQNTSSSGSLNTDQLAMALLTYRNTPDRDMKRSPAQVLYARSLRYAIPCDPTQLQLRPEWILTSKAREQALAKRHHLRGSDRDQHAHPLQPLPLTTVVQVQNQSGNNPNKWDKSGIIVEVLDHASYMVKLDGSGRITKRNRKFLRPIKPYSAIFNHPRDPQNTGGPITPSTGFKEPYPSDSNILPDINYPCSGTTAERASDLPDSMPDRATDLPDSQPDDDYAFSDGYPDGEFDDDGPVHREPLVQQPGRTC